MSTLPETGFVELPQIIGQRAVTHDEAAENKRTGKGPKRPRPAILPVFPVSNSSWFAGVQKGVYPAPVKFGRRSFWRVEAIRALLQQAG